MFFGLAILDVIVPIIMFTECSVCSRSGGSGWSAGRAGRVAAARAALHARLAGALLLDEPAAALDATAERALLAALAAVAPHTTIITVAVIFLGLSNPLLFKPPMNNIVTLLVNANLNARITLQHRISSVRGYERGVVLDSGCVVEQGAVAALLAQPGSRLARMLAAAQRPN